MFVLQQPHQITYRGQKVTVNFITNFPDNVTVDGEGNFYLTYWESASRLDTQQQRRQKKWRTQERHYRKFRDFFSLLRGMAQIIEKTQSAKLPLLEEVRSDCVNVRVTMTDLSNLKQQDVDLLRREIAQAWGIINRSSKPELREAGGQLECCILLRDKLDRVNVAALQARMVAVDNRLLERLSGVAGWMQNYVSWRQALEFFHRFHRQFLNEFESSLTCALSHEIFTTGQVRGNQPQYLVQSLTRHRSWLETLSHLKGFDRWARLCLQDLQQAKNFIAGQQFSQATNPLQTLIQSVRLKKIQVVLSNLLLHITLYALTQTPDWLDIFKQIEEVNQATDLIDETHFKVPVCQRIKNHLAVACSFLAASNVAPRNINQAKEALRQAIALF